ncbi:MAG: dihydrolipoamide acetyltransferase family protein, partial [Candidatus Caldatribacteriaceae bacterium]
ATMEIESYRDGVLLAILHQENEVVAVGEVVAYLGEQGELPPQEVEQKFTPEKREPSQSPTSGKAGSPEKPLASPLAKKLAREHHVQLAEVARALSREVIKKQDILFFLEKTPDAKAEEWYYLPLSPARRAIAQRVTASVASIPHYSISIEVNMSECITLRNHLKEHAAVRVAYHDFIMKCAAQVTEKYPLVNATFEGGEARVYRNVNFGLAVSVEGGLLIPVVKGVNRKSLLEVAQENQENIRKARNGELKPDDLSPGTITLSNLGMYDVDRFTAIINPPETCILAVGKITERPVCQEGMVVPRPIVTITASFDHRLIDGAYGAGFLTDLKRLLEDPWFLIR